MWTIYSLYIYIFIDISFWVRGRKRERRREEEKTHTYDGYSDVSSVCPFSFGVFFFFFAVFYSLSLVVAWCIQGNSGQKKREGKESVHMYVYMHTYIVLSWGWEFAFCIEQENERVKGPWKIQAMLFDLLIDIRWSSSARFFRTYLFLSWNILDGNYAASLLDHCSDRFDRIDGESSRVWIVMFIGSSSKWHVIIRWQWWIRNRSLRIEIFTWRYHLL